MVVTNSTLKLRRSKTYSCEDFACSTRCCIISLLIIATTRAEGPRDCVREEPQHMSVHLLHALHSWRSELCMKETVSPSVLLALEFHIFRLSNVNLKQEDNTWWQSVGNICFYSCHTESLQSSTRGKPFSPPSTTSRISKPGYRYRRLNLIVFVWICCILLDRWLTRSRSSWLQLRWPSRTYRWRSNQFWWWWSLVIDVLRNTIGSGGEAWLCDQVEWSKDSTDGAARQHWNHSQPGDHPAVRHWCVWPTLPFAGSHWDCPGLLARALWGQSAKQTWKQAKALLQGIPNSSKYLSTVFYQDLLKKSGDALKRNRQFIKKDQEAYQNQLEKSYHTCMEYLKPLLRCS